MTATAGRCGLCKNVVQVRDVKIGAKTIPVHQCNICDRRKCEKCQRYEQNPLARRCSHCQNRFM